MGPRTGRLFRVWRDHHVPPWEVLGTRWTTRAKRAWYLAADDVIEESRRTFVQQQQVEAAKRAAGAQAGAQPRPMGVPSARRVR